MKSIQLAVVLLIVCIGCAEALKCNRCVPFSPHGSCTTTTETCSGYDDVCGSVFCSYPAPAGPLHFRRCMTKVNVAFMEADRRCRVRTCSLDRCN